MKRRTVYRSIAVATIGAVVGLATLAVAGEREISDHLRHHGFNQFQIDATVSNSWNVDGLTQMYGFADDPLGAPGVSAADAAGVDPIAIGVELVRFTDASLLPAPVDRVTVLGEKLLIPFGDGPLQTDVDYLWYWAEMKGRIDFDLPGVGLNIAWPSYFDGFDRWESTFAGDSWIGGSHIPVVYNSSQDPLEWFADLFVVDGTSLNSYEGQGGLAWIEGSSLGFYAPLSAFQSGGGLAGQVAPPSGFGQLGLTEYGFASDITLNASSQFDPNAPRKVTVFPANFTADGRQGGLEPFNADGRFTMNVGFTPYADIIGARLLHDSDGALWAALTPLEGWPIDDPSGRFLQEYFSMAVGVRISYNQMDGPAVIQEFHDGASSTLGFKGSDEFTPTALHLLSDGTLRVKLDYAFGDLAAETDTVSLSTFGAFWNDEAVEDGRQQVGMSVDIPVSGIAEEDPFGNGSDLVAVFDFVTGEQLTTEADLGAADAPATSPSTTEAPSIAEAIDTTLGVEDALPTGVCWWCWGSGVGLVGLLLFILFFDLKSRDWWNCWLPWFVVTFVWIPFLLAGLWWWRPSWWWVPLMAWFPVVGGYAWFWAQRRSWRQPWHLYAVGGYLAVLAGAMVVVGSPEWGLLFPLFWLPWVGFYLRFRGMRQPWWRTELSIAVAVYVAWVFIWVTALTPWWAWWLPAALVATVGWWFMTQGLEWGTLLSPKWCWLLPFVLAPFGLWWIPLWGDWWGAALVVAVAATAGCFFRNRLGRRN